MCVKNVINVTVKALGKRMFGEPKYNKGILLNDSTYICLLIGFLFFQIKMAKFEGPTQTGNQKPGRLHRQVQTYRK